MCKSVGKYPTYPQNLDNFTLNLRPLKCLLSIVNVNFMLPKGLKNYTRFVKKIEHGFGPPPHF